MKILVDHCAYNNLGDTAMLESAVSRLLHTLPHAELFVIDRPILKTAIWDLDRVSREGEYLVNPFRGEFFGWLQIIRRHYDDLAKKTRNPALQYSGNEGLGGRLFRLLHTFRKYYKTLEKTNCSHSLQRIVKTGSAGYLSLYVKNNKHIRQKTLGGFCDKFDALHMVGGGYLTDMIHYELFNKCSLIHTFAEQSKPVILTGQQLGPFSSPLFKTALQKTLHKANFIGLREPTDSIDLCKEAEIDSKCYSVTGDDSFGLTPSKNSIILQKLDEYELQENGFMAFNIRLGENAKENEKYISKISSIIDKTARHFQIPVLIVPIALGVLPGIEDSDIESGKMLAKKIKSTRTHVIENHNLTPSLIKGILGKAFGAVGTSYHFCAFALSQGAPAVSIYAGDYYSQKAQGLSAFWKDKRLALSLRDIDVDAAGNHIINVLGDESLREKIGFLAKQAIEHWQTTFDKQVKDYFGIFA